MQTAALAQKDSTDEVKTGPKHSQSQRVQLPVSTLRNPEHRHISFGHTCLLKCLGPHAVNTLTNVWGLLLDVYKHIHLVSINANIITGEPNVSDGVPNDLLIVHFGSGCDLAKNHDHIGLCG